MSEIYICQKSPLNFLDFYHQPFYAKNLSFKYLPPILNDAGDKFHKHTRDCVISYTVYDDFAKITDMSKSRYEFELKMYANEDCQFNLPLFTITQKCDDEKCHRDPSEYFKLINGKTVDVTYEIVGRYEVYEMLLMAAGYNELLGGELIEMSKPVDLGYDDDHWHKAKIILRPDKFDDMNANQITCIQMILNLSVMLATIMYHHRNEENIKEYGYAHQLKFDTDMIGMNITEAALQCIKNDAEHPEGIDFDGHTVRETEDVTPYKLSGYGVYDYSHREFNKYTEWDKWQ